MNKIKKLLEAKNKETVARAVAKDRQKTYVEYLDKLGIDQIKLEVR